MSKIRPPDHWRHDLTTAHYTRWDHRIVPLTVLVSRSRTKDQREWWHVSVSRPDRLPTWFELSKVKDDFLGIEAEAYQVLAKRSDHINVHAHCLHLWSPLDGQRCVANLQDLIWEEAP